MKDKGYKVYDKIRRKLNKYIDRYDMDIVIDAMSDTLACLMKEDALDKVQHSIDIQNEIDKDVPADKDVMYN